MTSIWKWDFSEETNISYPWYPSVPLGHHRWRVLVGGILGYPTQEPPPFKKLDVICKHPLMK